MCGICGAITRNQAPPIGRALLRRMNETLRHRGPDDSGDYLDDQAGLAMRRLSIVDLVTGHQPIANEDGTIWTVFNGEIYNHRELRRRLEARGHAFTTDSDTEVIVHAYEEYGDDCLLYFNGMFGIAIWDTRRRRLLLARDRIGIKPVYYHVSSDRLVFGSELKAVVAHPDVPRRIDPVALEQFLTLEYIPSPRTIFQDVQKLPPGYRLILEDGREPQVERYWNVVLHPEPRSDPELVEQLTDLIRDAVRIRLVADVPLGAFLSGGLDSSTIVSFMAELEATPVRTFSVGFGDPTYNELPYARMVAEAFDTVHHDEILEPDIADLAVHLVKHLDEPVGDFSIMPTFLVSEMARRQVTVSLSGDGGDELFGGYDTYVAQRLDRRLYRHLPAWLRQRVLPRWLDLVPPRPAKKGLVNKAKRFVEGAALPETWQHTRWMMFMHERDKQQLYGPQMQGMLGSGAVGELIDATFAEVAGADPLAQQQYVDLKMYLADNILTKVDRMSMAVSLEARVPLLDHRIVEFALNLPPHLKLNGDETKSILRKVAAPRLPSAVLGKAKEGFSIPLKQWLCTDLRPIMNDLLAPETLRRRGYFDAGTVTRWIEEHQRGRANHSHRLWALMVFELWCQSMVDN